MCCAEFGTNFLAAAAAAGPNNYLAAHISARLVCGLLGQANNINNTHFVPPVAAAAAGQLPPTSPSPAPSPSPTPSGTATATASFVCFH